MALCIVFWATEAFAGGFAVSEQEASATGRAGAAIATTGTASSIHFNPAGLGFLDGPAAEAGATAIIPSLSANETSAATNVALPPHVYAAWGFEKLALGVGFNAPFGGSVRWPDDWFGRTELTEMNLRVLTGHLGGAWRVHERVSLGASLQVNGVSIGLTRRIDFVDTEGTAQLLGDGVAIGAQVGVDYRPADWVHLGLVGRIPASASLHGRAHFSEIPSAFFSTLPDQAISSSITLPGKVGLGAQLDTSVVRLVLETEVTFWQSFSRFAIDFESPSTPDVAEPRNWHTGFTFRVGAERDVGQATLRLGLVGDTAASPSDTLSPSLPDADRIGVSAGAGYAFGQFRADLAYQFVSFFSRASTGDALPARYVASAHMLALTLGYARH